MAMTHIYYYCDKCSKRYKVKCTGMDELPEKCKNCGSSKIWFQEIVRDSKPEPKVVLGRGGALHA